jgi:glycosyltransferase involved in cell wall biosynthesis
MNNQRASTGKPLLSLIIAVYKQPMFLELVLQSCLRQTFTDFEIIIADDGSGDEIREVIGRYSGLFTYPVVHCWHEDEGFRKTIIVNRAVVISNAEYIVFIDGDCILHRKFLENHWKYKKRNLILAGRRVRLDNVITKKMRIFCSGSGTAGQKILSTGSICPVFIILKIFSE